MKKNRKSGFTLIEIMIVVLIIGLLAAIAIPSFARARARSRISVCVNNLRQIAAGIDQYAMENNLAETAAVALTDLVPDYIKATPTCPAGGTYTLTNIATAPTCSDNTHALP